MLENNEKNNTKILYLPFKFLKYGGSKGAALISFSKSLTFVIS
jgi:hypothetical protein